MDARRSGNGARHGAPLRVGIVHDQGIFRDGLRALLSSEADLAIVAEAESLARAEAAMARATCDVLVVYNRLDRADLETISRLCLRVALIVVTDPQHDGVSMSAVRAGARAVVDNQLAVDGLLEAVRSVASGHVWIPPALQAELVADLRQMSSLPLTARERDVTRLVSSGLRNAEIAQALSISEQTVKKHLNNIFQKLKIRDRVTLARYAARSAWIGSHDGWGRSKGAGRFSHPGRASPR